MSKHDGNPKCYKIIVQGHIDPGWSDWFENMAIRPGYTLEGTPITTLSGHLVDQSALSGILIQLNDMNFPLVSVNPTLDPHTDT